MRANHCNTFTKIHTHKITTTIKRTILYDSHPIWNRHTLKIRFAKKCPVSNLRNIPIKRNYSLPIDRGIMKYIGTKNICRIGSNNIAIR